MSAVRDLDVTSLERVVDRLLAEAKAQGATSADADVSIVKGLSVNVRLGEVETVEFNKDRGLGITVYFGKRKGSASTSDFSDDAIAKTVAAACGIAKYTAEDPCNGLAEAVLMAHGFPDLDLYHPWEMDAERAIELAQVCEAAARGLDARITNSEGASVSTHEGLRLYGNTHGFTGAYPTSRHSISCSVIAQDGESMQRDYWYTSARRPKELYEPESIGRRAAERALRRLGGRRVKTAKIPVVYAADVASGLLSHLLAAIRGDSIYRRSSFLLDKLGEAIFPNFIDIVEQPHLKGALGSAPFDAEGVVTRDRHFVRGGILESYVLDSYSARKLGMKTTGNAGGVRNLTLTSGQQDLAGLLRTMHTGLLVTELMGQGVNKVTGDYSRGAAGFWVENGEIQYPVEEITIAGNLKEMFMGIREVGNDIEPQRSTRCGSILIEQMTVAGA